MVALRQDDAGSSPAEFVLVGGLLTLLTISILQFGVTVYARNVIHDAAVEGAFHGALADVGAASGADRTRELLARTLGADYAAGADVTAETSGGDVEVTVTATLPLIGLLGVPLSLEVAGRAPIESLE